MLERPISSLSGIGEKKAHKLHKLGIDTIYDALYQFPFRYVDRRKILPLAQVNDGDYAVVVAKVIDIKIQTVHKTKKELMILKVVSHYLEGEMVFFTPKYIKDYFKRNETYYFFGKIEKRGLIFKINQPEYAPENQKSFLSIVPIYPLTLGVTQYDQYKLHRNAINQSKGFLEETLDKSIREMFDLCPIEDAIEWIHFPVSKETYLKAKRRIVFEELFELQMRLVLIKNGEQQSKCMPFQVPTSFYRWLETLPFQLTSAQKKVVDEIIQDLTSGHPMNRLIQGDVGSGKTILAFAALYLTTLNHKQGALMAPTTLLAEQHYEAFKTIFGDTISVALLTSQMKNSEKKALKEALLRGEIQVLIGTHAVIQEDVFFSSLGLVITDEQHRFGIKQRLSAISKGTKPHALIMSATPIPRTLSLIVYGDMNVSVIDTLPIGRKPIKTHFVSTRKKNEMYAFVKKQLCDGRQVYFVCPLVEMSEKMDLTSATEHYETLKSEFHGFQVGMVHGKMKSQEKELVMHAFKNNEIQVLVSTTVIEVGINVPNATVMVILDTDRFGLAQLHQLRGRVGRGADQSYCFLLSDKLSKVAKERIETLVNTNSGFEIAEKDLSLRGPGEVFGLRQHGLPELKLADLVKDKKILAEAQKCVKIVISEYKLGNKKFKEMMDRLIEKNNKGFTL